MPKFACGWGWLEIDGMRFEKDVVVHVDGSVTPRAVELSHPYRTEYFHVPLSELELGFLEEEKPEVVIVGAGHKGMMTITPKAKELLSRYVVIEGTTENAVKAMNAEKRRFVAILHSTC
ncbi:MAG: MTH938/NDUFAF3 family protein [Methanomassiliicoccales archaeon]|nr:MTH938/NDUFAF3 family protein [Methanomassiliicoccales archaeon]